MSEPLALHGGTRIDQNLLGIRRKGMDGFQIHGRLAVTLSGHAAQDFRGEPRQIEGRRVRVEVRLVEAVEREHQHCRALAGVTGVVQRLGVVGAHQSRRCDALVGNVARRHRRAGFVVGDVTQ